MSPQRTGLGYSRRGLMRRFLQWLSRVGFRLLTNLEIYGEENFPESGPLIVVANHFSFIDPAALVRVVPWPLEFIGGAQMPFAPKMVTLIPRLWGVISVYRGTGSRAALRGGEEILNAGGILGVFPEGGFWTPVLRPARPGAAYLAARTGAKLLPIGIDGLTEALPSLFRGRRATVILRVGKPFGPLKVSGKGRERREQIDEIGHQIMRRIAELIPPEKRGHYSDDPAVREAAKGTEVYPWASQQEGEVNGRVR